LSWAITHTQRIKMYPGKEGEAKTGEFAPFALGEPLQNFLLAEVVASKAEGLRAGDLVVGMGAWRKFSAVDAAAFQKVNPEVGRLRWGVVGEVGLCGAEGAAAVWCGVVWQFPLPTYLNALGIIGLSTYFPVVEIGRPKAGETVFVSGAAGAVGSLAGQLFKAFGCRVIGERTCQRSSSPSLPPRNGRVRGLVL
jgi:NADPH:quinone reductase